MLLATIVLTRIVLTITMSRKLTFTIHVFMISSCRERSLQLLISQLANHLNTEIFIIIAHDIVIHLMFRIKTKNKNKISQVPPSTDAQFPLCTATERRWSRKSVDRGSPVSNAILLPTSLTNSRDLGPIAPMVSIESGQNK